jgi:hypothetical protein
VTLKKRPETVSRRPRIFDLQSQPENITAMFNVKSFLVALGLVASAWAQGHFTFDRLDKNNTVGFASF